MQLVTELKDSLFNDDIADLCIDLTEITLKLEVGQVVYIPGVADIRDTTEGDKVETITAMSKDEKVLAYIRQNGSISMKKVMEIGNYRSRTGARKLIDKMINADLIEKMGEGNKTIYKIKE